MLFRFFMQIQHVILENKNLPSDLESETLIYCNLPATDVNSGD